VPVETTEGKYKLNRLQLNVRKRTSACKHQLEELLNPSHDAGRGNDALTEKGDLQEAGKKLACLPRLNKKEGKEATPCLGATGLVSFGEPAG